MPHRSYPILSAQCNACSLKYTQHPTQLPHNTHNIPSAHGAYDLSTSMPTLYCAWQCMVTSLSEMLPTLLGAVLVQGNGLPDEAKLERATAALEAASLAVEALQARRSGPPQHHNKNISTALVSDSQGTSQGIAPGSSAISSGSPGAGTAIGIEGRHRSAPLHHRHQEKGKEDVAHSEPMMLPLEAMGRHHRPPSLDRPSLPTPAPFPAEPSTSGPSSSGTAVGTAGGILGHMESSGTPPLRSWMASRLDQLRRKDRGLQSAKTVSMLKQVLETFTDVTRYPRQGGPCGHNRSLESLKRC